MTFVEIPAGKMEKISVSAETKKFVLNIFLRSVETTVKWQPLQSL